MKLQLYYDQYYRKWNSILNDFVAPQGVRCITSSNIHPQQWRNGIAIQPHPAHVNAGLHYHDFFEIIYIHRGSCQNVIDQKEVTLTEGDLCLLNTNAVHNILCSDPERTIIFNILIQPSVLESAHFKLLSFNNFIADFFSDSLKRKQVKDNYILFHSLSRQQESVSMCVQLITEYHEQAASLYHDSKLTFLFDCLLIDLIRSYQEQYDLPLHTKNKSYRLSDIISYMDANLSHLTLDALSDHFGYHPKYFSRILQQATGRSYAALIQELRLNHAKALLEDTSLTTTEIIHRIGYKNNTWFFSQFRKQFGMTPAAYRRLHQKAAT